MLRSSDGEASLELQVDEGVEPVREWDEGHPSKHEEEVPVLPGGGEGSKDDLERGAEQEDELEWAENTGDLIVDEIVDVPAEGVDIVVLVDSVGVDLAAFGLGVVIPVEIPGVSSTYSIPEDEEREGRPPKGNPDIASSEELVTSLLECVDSLWVLQRWHVWSLGSVSGGVDLTGLVEVPLESLFPLGDRQRLWYS